jgi:hypothetical protein
VTIASSQAHSKGKKHITQQDKHWHDEGQMRLIAEASYETKYIPFQLQLV